MCPQTQQLGSSYVDALAEDQVGLSDFMLSYSWRYRVSDIVAALLQHCSSQRHELLRSWEKRLKEPLSQGTYFWICCLCINQHRVKEAKGFVC